MTECSNFAMSHASRVDATALGTIPWGDPLAQSMTHTAGVLCSVDVFDEIVILGVQKSELNTSSDL